MASANVKHFLDHVSRDLHLAPEFSDKVHYAIVLRVKPFRLHVYRGTGREYLPEGSLEDIGWGGLLKELATSTQPRGEQT